MLDLMDNTSFGVAALRKFGSVPDRFHVFEATFLEEPPAQLKRVRVSGAQFDGVRRIPHTTMSTIATREEIKRCDVDA